MEDMYVQSDIIERHQSRNQIILYTKMTVEMGKNETMSGNRKTNEDKEIGEK